MLSKWLSKKDIMAMTGVSRYMLDAAIKAGNLRFQMMGKRMMFTLKDVEQWQNNTTNHIDYTSAAKSTTYIFHTSEIPAQEYSLDALVKQRSEQKLKDLLLRKLQPSKNKRRLQPAGA